MARINSSAIMKCYYPKKVFWSSSPSIKKTHRFLNNNHIIFWENVQWADGGVYHCFHNNSDFKKSLIGSGKFDILGKVL